MFLLRSIAFRVRRLLGYETPARPDLIPCGEVKRWRAKQRNCSIEIDLEVRGRADALARIRIKARAEIDRTCIFWLADEEGADPLIALDHQVYIGPFCYLGSFQPLAIGANTIIGARCYLITGNHRSDRKDVPIRNQGFVGAPIVIGSNVWLGCHVVVLPGVTIGDGAIVGAGAVVTHDIPAGQTWGGVPARRIK
jgi:acetyltransferase-like isoleucine patch superfamily enzyme